MQLHWVSWLSVAAVCLASALPSHAAARRGVYETGFRNVTNINADLVLALDPLKRRQVSSNTLFLGTVRLPCVASSPGVNPDAPGQPVRISSSFIDFINHVAHAKAVDEVERGFFLRYTTRLAEDPRTMLAPDFDVLLPQRAWNFNTMNRQASHFNQMVGGLLGIDHAHHYLGHYRKNAKLFELQTALPQPINAVISESEWRKAVLEGARNALACGLGVDGMMAIFECFGQMPTRPAWAAYFIHPQANVQRIILDLVQTERDFFAMDAKPRKIGPIGKSSFNR
jgi:hypothetical protein